nr:MAG TPA: hypothetical protein [Bacteriophage sp.]
MSSNGRASSTLARATNNILTKLNSYEIVT